MTTLTLSGLYIYPIKSAAGIAISQAQMTARGLQYDRRWMVVDAQGKFMSQRRFPRLALIKVAITDQLKITAPGMPDCSIPLTACSDTETMVEVWGDRVPAVASPAEVDKWFTQFLGVTCQLVHMPDSSQRPTDHGKLGSEQIVSFADAYPFLLISSASLAHLNEKLDSPVPMNRFRPNFVVSGCDRPHAEDDWQQIRIGDVAFSVAKPCARCSIPNVDQATGKRALEPTKTLATYRAWDKAIWFGQNLVEIGKGDRSGTRSSTLSVGDEIEVLA
ncbi:MOSC domain-containing protein [cf. Phormidesmis sp. LEGE 11477]|uniref:MOSC domain-containing protein n=1 Tax=cf. Phormidesmis sp. LEGE 11477 TaxID=1828680 RepID=UPI0018823F87|nr:MOSC N-terminal beta barrel domain-containing protein [cf. Phormidesmis sp. LEGE 11477]MBE9064217.1 MOSC N-terminal beta barrel domain-containing protein [cf. Phormidesmis sp. LEGE 11477]